MKIKTLAKLKAIDSFGYMYKDVAYLKSPCHHIKLKGPPILNVSNWNVYVSWINSIEDDWIKQCSVSMPKAHWGYSSTEDKERTHFILHYWFEDKNDALMFKLISSDYA